MRVTLNNKVPNNFVLHVQCTEQDAESKNHLNSARHLRKLLLRRKTKMIKVHWQYFGRGLVEPDLDEETQEKSVAENKGTSNQATATMAGDCTLK